MPLLATLIGNISVAFAAFLSRWYSFSIALKLAAYTAWMVVVAAFVVAVAVSVNTLVTGMSALVTGTGGASAIATAFLVGVGMLIPSNAATVVACTASVWIACQVYKLQKQGMHHYSK